MLDHVHDLVIEIDKDINDYVEAAQSWYLTVHDIVTTWQIFDV